MPKEKGDSDATIKVLVDGDAATEDMVDGVLNLDINMTSQPVVIPCFQIIHNDGRREGQAPLL
jgi:hypothetical protein